MLIPLNIRKYYLKFNKVITYKTVLMEKKKSQEINRRSFLQKSSMAALSAPFLNLYGSDLKENLSVKSSVTVRQEWRNKQEGMVYRQLGRTGFLVSELVYGILYGLLAGTAAADGWGFPQQCHDGGIW